MLAPVRTSAPPAPVVTFDEAKLHLRVDSDEDDPLITSLINAATAHLDGWAGILGRCLVNQQWRVDFCGWPGDGVIRLPFPDVSAVEIKYSDGDDVEHSVASDDYQLLDSARGTFVRFRSSFAYPTVHDDRADAVRVALTAGYGASGTDVPAPIRTAILLTVGHLYEHREAVADSQLADLPFGAMALIAPYRRTGV